MRIGENTSALHSIAQDLVANELSINGKHVLRRRSLRPLQRFVFPSLVRRIVIAFVLFKPQFLVSCAVPPPCPLPVEDLRIGAPALPFWMATDVM